MNFIRLFKFLLDPIIRFDGIIAGPFLKAQALAFVFYDVADGEFEITPVLDHIDDVYLLVEPLACHLHSYLIARVLALEFLG